MSIRTTDWFTSWFNTPYYYILYRDRGYDEAQSFMDNLMSYLNLGDQAAILDLACGKGRHSIYLNKMGYDVTGLDLSRESILHAKQYENDRLHFDVHDMSLPYHKTFDAVLNLFTSFGYFDDEADNFNTIKSILTELNPGGVAVIDFMNVHQVMTNLVSENKKSVDGIDFNLSRRIEDGFIIKTISFEDNGQQFDYEERVKALEMKDFDKMISKAGGKILDVLGDYDLNKFQLESSDRLILIFGRDE